ncbi:flagellar hook-length control protein FliK [Halobacillus sp. Marseille-P3879]|uniref:flagellar hook-length control protein FliK n=1 Tax=Halobacillus sp. Marseille-P3879 TaxID=2045014 RepID=UPI001F220BF7|nr:flagellar hook-length control protein FliK [Halobacillus sp. Marseille-P3879]
MMAQMFSSMPKSIDSRFSGASTKKTEAPAFAETFRGLLEKQPEGPISFKEFMSNMKKSLEAMGLSFTEEEVELDSEQLKNVISELETENAGLWMEEGVPGHIQALFENSEEKLAELDETNKTVLMENFQKLTEGLQLATEGTGEVKESLTQLMLLTGDTNGQSVKKPSLEGPLLNEMKEIWSKFEKISTQLTSLRQENGGVLLEDIDQKMSTELKQVLEQVSKLAGQTKDGKAFQDTLVQISRNGSSEQQQLFAHLIKNYSDRKSVPSGYYQQTRNRDIAKWAAQTLSRNITNDQKSITHGGGFQSVMSNVEQYVLHVNQNQSQGVPGSQFMEQFEQLIKSSRLFRNGQSEMNIRLKPQHLGDMNIKILQMNGEMTVKITVTTQAAKDILENNVNQLRHMFSPQQVVVDKSDIASGEQFFSQEEKEAGGFKDQQPSQSEDDHDAEDSSEEETVSFKELLVNEQV